MRSIPKSRLLPSPAVVGLVIAWSGVVFAPAAEGCTCMAPGPPQEEMARAAAVFAGRVVAIDPLPNPDDSPNWPSRLKVTVELLRVWKGVEEGTSVTLLTAAQSAACGYTFEKGKRYVIYAYGKEPELTATLCSRTAPWKRAEEDFAALGTPLRTLP